MVTTTPMLFFSSIDSLMALPPPTTIQPNRSWIKRITHVHHYPQSITLPLTCLSIGKPTSRATSPTTNAKLKPPTTPVNPRSSQRTNSQRTIRLANLRTDRHRTPRVDCHAGVDDRPGRSVGDLFGGGAVREVFGFEGA